MSTKKSALSYHEALAVYDRIDPSLRLAEKKRKEILDLDPSLEMAKIEDLRKGHAEAHEALKNLEDQRENLFDNPTPDRDLNKKIAALGKRIEGVNATIEKMGAAFVALEELLKVEGKIKEYTAALEEPIEIILQARKKKQEIPEQILTEEEAYEDALRAEKTAEIAARSKHSIEAVEVFEKNTLPQWKQIQWSLNQHTIAEHRGGIFADNQFVGLDEAAAKQIVGVMKRFPENPGLKTYIAQLEEYLTNYIVGYKEYTAARDAGDKTNAMRLYDEKLLPSFIRLKELPSMSADWVTPFKQAYEQELKTIQAAHAPEIAAAEKRLFATLPTTNDREDLIKLRMGEAPPVPEHPVVEKLKTPEGQKEEVDKILSDLGIPVTVDAVKKRFQELKEEVGKNAIADGTKVKTKAQIKPETDAWEAMRQDAALFLDAGSLSQKARELTTERVKRMSITGGDERLVKILSKGLFPENDASNIDPRTKLEPVVAAYIKELAPVTAATTSDEEKAKAMDAALAKLSDLRTKFGQLLSGEIQEAQAKAGVAPANRALPKEEYLRTFVDVAGGTAPTAPPDTRRQTAEASVNQFVTSMERVAALQKEGLELNAARNNVRKASEAGRNAVEKVNTLATNLRTTEETVQKLATLRLERGYAGEEATARTKRNELITNWGRTHAAEVAEKTAAEKKTKSELTKAEQEAEAAEKSPRLKQLDEELTTIELVIYSLKQGDLSPFLTQDEKREALLKNIKVKVEVNGQDHAMTALGLINQVAVRQSLMPIGGFAEWAPPTLRKIPFSRLTGASEPVETVLQSAYALASGEAAPVCELAEWFEKNGSVAWYRRLSNAESNPELVAKATALRAELQKSYDVVAVERDIAVEKARQAAATKSTLTQKFTQEAATTLTARASAFKDILTLLDRDLSHPKKVNDKDLLDHCMRGLAATVYQHTGEDVKDPSTTQSANTVGFRALTASIQRLKGPLKPAYLTRLVAHVESDGNQLKDYSKKLTDVLKHLETGPSLTKEDNRPQTLKEAYVEIETLKDRLQDLRTTATDATTRHLIAEQELTQKNAETVDMALALFDAETLAEERKLDPSGDIELLQENLRAELAQAKEVRRGAKQEFITAVDALITRYAAWLDRKTSLLTLTGPAATESEKLIAAETTAEDAEIFSLFAVVDAPKNPNAAEFSRWWATLAEDKKVVFARKLAPALYSTTT